jgi:hypothetical protein
MTNAVGAEPEAVAVLVANQLLYDAAREAGRDPEHLFR